MSVINMRTATITEKGQISIPKDLRKVKGFRNGEKIMIIAHNDFVELRPLNKIIAAMKNVAINEKSLAKHWNSKEDEEAWKNL
jgi:AbrB family looped-hinge helix DNA binding protein